MKTSKSFIILIMVASFAACKKEFSQSASTNAVAQNNVTANSDKACPEIDPSNFVEEVRNPYFPLKPGTTYYYVNRIVEDNEISIEHNVEGSVTEDTYDWYAQDKHGNVWYMGEDTKEREDTGWSTEGSWEAGVEGACAGIIMLAHPERHLGEIYYQEFLKGEAEDQAQVINTNSTVKIPLGIFDNCLDTKEFTRLEQGVASHKFYAPGMGEIKEVQTRGGAEVDELIKVTPP
jgi:hypothetical protein